MSARSSSPAGAGSPSCSRVSLVNVILLALCMYLGASLLVLNRGRTLHEISPGLTRVAFHVLFTPLNPVWRYASLPGYERLTARFGSSPPATRSASATAAADADGRAAELSASRQIDDAGRIRLREEIESARQAYKQLAASGRHREAAIALSSGIAAASRLDDLDSLEELVDLQVEALKKGPAQ